MRCPGPSTNSSQAPARLAARSIADLIDELITFLTVEALMRRIVELDDESRPETNEVAQHEIDVLLANAIPMEAPLRRTSRHPNEVAEANFREDAIVVPDGALQYLVK